MALSLALLLDFNLLKLEAEREEPEMENRECGSSTGNGKMKIEKQKGNELGITDRARFAPSFLVSRSSCSYHVPRSPFPGPSSSVRHLRKGINFSFWETANQPLP